MTTSIPALIYLLLISNLLLLCAVGLAVVRFLSRCDEIERFWDSPTGNALSDSETERANLQESVQLQLSQRLEKRVDDLHRIVRLMAAKGSSKTSAEKPSAPITTILPLENAVRMAKQGASVEDLTRSCGLNFGEAKLMQKLHGKRVRSTA